MSNLWTTEETEYLHDNLGILYYDEIALKLGRTPGAVRDKAFNMGITLYDNIYTYTLLSKELGVCRGTIRRWYNLGLINGKKATWTSKRMFHKVPMIFTENDVTEFIENYPDFLARVLLDKQIPNLYFRNLYRGITRK